MGGFALLWRGMIIAGLKTDSSHFLHGGEDDVDGDRVVTQRLAREMKSAAKNEWAGAKSVCSPVPLGTYY